MTFRLPLYWHLFVARPSFFCSIPPKKVRIGQYCRASKRAWCRCAVVAGVPCSGRSDQQGHFISLYHDSASRKPVGNLSPVRQMASSRIGPTVQPATAAGGASRHCTLVISSRNRVPGYPYTVRNSLPVPNPSNIIDTRFCTNRTEKKFTC